MTKKKRWKCVVYALCLVLISIPLVWLLLMPDVGRLRTENPKKTSFMEYREKEAREKGRPYRVSQTWVPLNRISPFLIKAVLIAEDDKFWRHEGFDYEAIQKAIEKDLKAKRFKLGGSTISQQLSKNLYLSPSKNPFRKIAEAAITWRMERLLTKKRILEIYLNIAEWGDGIFGIEEASRHYYGRPATDLGPEESSRLAAVLPNPRKYHPLKEQRYVVNRSGLIYRIMVQRGIVEPEYRDVAGESNGPDIWPVPIEKTQPSD